jgi:hypothetical protein
VKAGRKPYRSFIATKVPRRKWHILSVFVFGPGLVQAFELGMIELGSRVRRIAHVKSPADIHKESLARRAVCRKKGSGCRES